MRNRLFAIIAKSFPTDRISGNKIISALWRALFYAFAPSRPFLMKTRYYRIMAHPKKGTLTRAVIRRGYWEKTETEAFIKHLKPGALVVDAGANFGHYALVASRFVGENGHVYAFEPDAKTFSLLQSNVALLDEPNVTPVLAGLSDTEGTLDLMVDNANPGGHSYVRDNVRGFGGSTQTIVHALDDYLREHEPERPLSLIKIDVQGYEYKLILGARKRFLKDRPVVFCEVTPDAMEKSGDDYRSLMTFFRDAGYSVQFIDTRVGRVEDVTYEEAEEILARPEREYADLIFLP